MLLLLTLQVSRLRKLKCYSALIPKAGKVTPCMNERLISCSGGRPGGHDKIMRRREKVSLGPEKFGQARNEGYCGRAPAVAGVGLPQDIL